MTPRDDERALERAGSRSASSAAAPRSGSSRSSTRELVAAEPRERVAAPQRVAQPLGDVAQQPVAVVVAERVVDLLEAVEVDQQQADQSRRAAARRAVARRDAAGTARSGSAAR